MKRRNPLKQTNDLAGCKVLVTKGEKSGNEGIVLGKGDKAGQWIVSLDGENGILEMGFPKEISLLFDGSGQQGLN